MADLEVQENNKTCEYCNSPGFLSKKYNKILCAKHYAQLKNIGSICNTKYDMNEIIEYENCIGIITKNSKYETTGEFLIDKEDYVKVKNIRWRNSKGYAINNSKENLYLHRIIMDTPDNMICDHINRNTFDCRKYNLRNVYKHENNLNTKRSNSIVPGVNKHRNGWRSRITYNGKEYHLGIFVKYIDAVRKRLQIESLLFGQFSPLYNNSTDKLEVKFYDEESRKYYFATCCIPKPVNNIEFVECSLEQIINK